MELIILGSGTSTPHPKRSSSAYWIEIPGGTLLLDCSPTAAHRMAEEGLDWADLDAIWISHFHLDHCGGLAPFLFGTKYAVATRARTKPLRIFGPQGLGRLIERFDDANNYRLMEQIFPIEVVEVEPLEKFRILNGVEAVAMKTPHAPESLAIHLRDENGQTLVFTSDTGYDERIGAFARHVDLLLMECSFVRNKPIEKHLELVEAVDLIRRTEPKKAILTHLYPEWDDVNFKELIGEYSTKSEVIQAFDGLTLDLRKFS